MQNKTDFVRTAALQLYAASSWRGTAGQAVTCAEGLYDALRQKGYGFAETARPETLTCPQCRGSGECHGGPHTFDCYVCNGSGTIKALPRKP